MLEFMRKSAGSIFVKALLGLLIASFAVWGIGDMFRGRSTDAGVATVGNIKITSQTFRSELAREIQRVQQRFGPSITRDQALSMGVGDALLGRLVNDAVISAGAQDMGLYISEKAIAREIKNSKSFYNDAGVFDRRVFTQLLSRNGLTEDTYVQYVRDNMIRNQIMSPIIGGTVAPTPLVQALYSFAAEKRVLDVIRISHASIQNVPKPSTSDLEAYHKANAKDFMAPQYRALTAIVLNAADIAKTLSVTDDELQTSYDERADEFMGDETRSLQQILVKDESTAKKAAELLDKGTAVVDVAKAVGANTAMIAIGTMTRKDTSALSKDIADAAFTTAKGAHSAPVKSPLGWHVIIVNDITPGTVQAFVDVKDKLAKDLKLNRALDQLFQLSNQLEDLLGSGKTYEEAASDLGITLTKTKAVDARGLTPAGSIAPLPFAADILKEAVKLQKGGESSLTESADNNAFFVVRVDDIIEPKLRPLNTVKDAVSQAWTAETRTKMAADIATKAQTRLESGEDVFAVAKDLGFAAFVTTPFTRTGQGLKQGALPATVIAKAFILTTGGVAQAPGTGAHTVIRVQAIQAASDGKNDPLFTSISSQTQGTLQNDLAAQMTEAFQLRYPVRVNQTALNEIY